MLYLVYQMLLHFSISIRPNYTRMLRAILNKSWRQHPTRHQLYGHLPPISKTIQVRQTRHAGHCWRSKDELISDVLLWTPTYGRAKAGWLARTYIQQLCEDTGCSPKDLPEAMNDREKWREKVRDIRASGTTWWWWWWHFNLKYSVGLFSFAKTFWYWLIIFKQYECFSLSFYRFFFPMYQFVQYFFIYKLYYLAFFHTVWIIE